MRGEKGREKERERKRERERERENGSFSLPSMHRSIHKEGRGGNGGWLRSHHQAESGYVVTIRRRLATVTTRRSLATYIVTTWSVARQSQLGCG